MPPGLCPNVAATGACTTRDCPYRHERFACDLCSVVCPSQRNLNQHLNGRQHRRNLEGGVRGPPKRCQVCDIVVAGGERDIEIHENGRRHRQGVAEYEGVGMPVPDWINEEPGELVRCTLCNQDVSSSVYPRHLVSPAHRRKERFARYKVALEEAESDKYGVVVEETTLDFGIVEVDSLRNEPTREGNFHIKLTEPGTILLKEARMSSSVGRYSGFRQVSFTPRLAQSTRLIQGRTCNLAVTFNPRGDRGHYEDRIELVFEDYVTQHPFAIIRPVRAIVGVQADHDLLKPTAPYVRPQPRPAREPELEVVEGVPPPALAEIVWTVPLPKADIPAYVWSAIDQPSISETVQRVERTLLPGRLHAATYARHWKALLWLDEIQATKDLCTYDMNGVAFAEIHRQYYYLEVPGLAEKRPSVIVGDRILVRPAAGSVARNTRSNAGRTNDGGGRWFEGYVHKVEQLRVALVFNRSFHAVRNQRFDVRFRLSRLPLRRMHQALATSFLEPRVLFPSRATVQSLGIRRPTTAQIERMRPFNREVAANEPQWLAVAAIRHMRPGSTPFVVFGPPGTGKTNTIIEAIRQILHEDPDAKIFACAPSNSAADIIAERLTRNGALNNRELFRLNAPSRLKDTLPHQLTNFVLTNGEGTFSIPPLNALKRYRVVVSTCLSASVPYGIGVSRGHFTHIFIDEAGQAMEPEAMIPVKTAAGPGTNIILSGDPKQLGPIIRSAVAQKLGLGTSWLDRLMSLPEYDPYEYNGVTVVKLIKNWRSHPDILRFPNDEFYQGDLEAHADPVITESCLRWDQLPSSTFPLIFHAIKGSVLCFLPNLMEYLSAGKDERQASSPSFFNIEEASAVRSYVRDLKEHRSLRLTDDHIGVISPYNAQCQKIRIALKNQHPRIKVGSVEEFQGQERRVVIISTVRSSMDYVSYDLRHTLGFVSNPRRFNVAITRAQALVIIVGDPDVLSLDPLWRSFLNYIHNNGGWKGRRIAWDPRAPVERAAVGATARTAGVSYGMARRREMETEMDELVDRVRSMVLNQVPVDETDTENSGVERMEANADRPWREAE